MSAAEPPNAWYREAFRRRYLELYRHRSPEAAEREVRALAARLRWTPGRSVLDLCCGAGRHSHVLRSLGMHVVGLDLSADLLRAQRVDAPDARVVRGDMRRLPFAAASFELVVQLFTSFGYFERVEEDEEVLAEAARVSARGGVYVLDLMNRTRVLAHLVPHSVERRDGREFEQWRSFDPDTQCVVKRVAMEREDGRVERWVERVRLFAPEDLGRRLQRCGWTLETFLGSFAGEAFEEGRSERMIAVARR